MSTAQWFLNCTLLGWVLLRNLGSKPLTRGLLLVPIAVCVVAAAVFLRDLPTAGHDLTLELVGLTIGLLLGGVATLLTRIDQTGRGLVVQAGAGFALLWVVVIGGRIAFAEWANGVGASSIGRFSMQHAITGADAWTAAFVLMALAMVVGRVVTTAARAALRRRQLPLVAVPA
ncbi:MAG: hypothetical protein ACTHK1_00200 [Actinomycetales bacterium]